jgi:hypothetical protein
MTTGRINQVAIGNRAAAASPLLKGTPQRAQPRPPVGSRLAVYRIHVHLPRPAAIARQARSLAFRPRRSTETSHTPPLVRHTVQCDRQTGSTSFAVRVPLTGPNSDGLSSSYMLYTRSTYAARPHRSHSSTAGRKSSTARQSKHASTTLAAGLSNSRLTSFVYRFRENILSSRIKRGKLHLLFICKILRFYARSKNHCHAVFDRHVAHPRSPRH